MTTERPFYTRLLCYIKGLISRLKPFVCKSLSLLLPRRASTTLPYPPGPPGLPLVGNILQLRGDPLRVLNDWARQYGHVYSLQLGAWPCVVISGHSSVVAGLTARGDSFSGRPPFSSYQNYAGGLSISFQTYSKMLQAHRRVVGCCLASVIHDTSQGFEATLSREVSALLGRLHHHQGAPVDPHHDICWTIGSILYSVCFGFNRKLADDPEYVQLILSPNPTSKLFGAGNHIDVIPGAKLAFWTVRRHNLRMEHFLAANSKKVEEKRAALSGDIGHRSDGGILENLLSLIFDDGHRVTKTIPAQRLEASTIEVISAGVDTSTATLLWILLYMAQFPDIQSEIALELSQHLDPERRCVLADKERLPLAEASMWEVMRLRTIVPFALPHYTTCDTTFLGFHIPKDTLVFFNLWSVCRDPRLWHQPDRFSPHRFLSDGPGGQKRVRREMVEALLPFSAGRRRCIGERLARTQVFVIFVEILRHFQISATPGLDPAGVFGDVYKPEAFTIRFASRQTETPDK